MTIQWYKMANINITPEEVFSKILNKLSYEENNLEDIAFLASDDYKNSKDRLNIT